MIAWQRATKFAPFSLLMALGCVSCISLHGAWYYQTDDDSDSAALYLAIVNNKDAFKVTEVSINAVERTATVGWSCRGNQMVARGQLLVLSLPTQDRSLCAVPVNARLLADNDRWINIDLSDAMPTALPGAWRNCPLSAAPRKEPAREKSHDLVPPNSQGITDRDAAEVGSSLQCTPAGG